MNNKLPVEYRNALQGLKQQAHYATESIKGANPQRSDLTNAHRTMSQNKMAISKIVKLAMSKGVSIPDMSEDWVLGQLVREGDLSVSHLMDKPLYYLACNVVDGVEYYFITTYFNDVKACGGHSSDKQDVISMSTDSVLPYTMDYIEGGSEALRRSLTMPDVISHVATLNIRLAQSRPFKGESSKR